MAGDAGSELSRGGMITKIAAAKIAVAAGANLVIASGKIMHPLRALGEGAPCTWFLAPPIRSSPASAGSRARWSRAGVVIIDAGARAALDAGRSLLPAGVSQVEGAFDRGDAVMIKDAERPRAGARADRLCARRRRAADRPQER